MQSVARAVGVLKSTRPCASSICSLRRDLVTQTASKVQIVKLGYDIKSLKLMNYTYLTTERTLTAAQSR